MKKEKKGRGKRCWAMSLLLCSILFSTQNVEALETNAWKIFHSQSGNCKIAFPTIPKHLQEKFVLPKSKATVSYDAYISSDKPQTVYMMLIANYPMPIDPTHQKASLESFIKGLVRQGGKIVFANFFEIPKATVMEFFIQNENMYFKGRAIMKGNKLYLIAMESLESQYEDKFYHQFIESFGFL